MQQRSGDSMLLGSTLPGTIVPLIVADINSIRDHLVQRLLAKLFHHVEQFVFAMEAAGAVVAYVVGIIQLAGVEDGKGNAVLFGKASARRAFATAPGWRKSVNTTNIAVPSSWWVTSRQPARVDASRNTPLVPSRGSGCDSAQRGELWIQSWRCIKLQVMQTSFPRQQCDALGCVSKCDPAAGSCRRCRSWSGLARSGSNSHCARSPAQSGGIRR